MVGSGVAVEKTFGILVEVGIGVIVTVIPNFELLVFLKNIGKVRTVIGVIIGTVSFHAFGISDFLGSFEVGVDI